MSLASGLIGSGASRDPDGSKHESRSFAGTAGLLQPDKGSHATPGGDRPRDDQSGLNCESVAGVDTGVANRQSRARRAVRSTFPAETLNLDCIGRPGRLPERALTQGSSTGTRSVLRRATTSVLIASVMGAGSAPRFRKSKRSGGSSALVARDLDRE